MIGHVGGFGKKVFSETSVYFGVWTDDGPTWVPCQDNKDALLLSIIQCQPEKKKRVKNDVVEPRRFKTCMINRILHLCSNIIDIQSQ